MIDAEMRVAIITLNREGVGIREIAKKLRISRNTVRRILKKPDKSKDISVVSAEKVDPEKLAALFADCDGWVQRIHEKLREHGVEIGYSTLTRLIRKQGLGEPVVRRHDQVADVPGAEMQHDTSPYTREIGGKPMKIVASLLYYRYSKSRYLKFYPSFTRFQMKCFFYEGLKYYKYVAPICVIDNTNLAVHHGTGKDAVFNREMEEFAKSFGFKWLAHAKGHSDRKAGEERSFWTVETNFFPGRKFSSLEDLNDQAKNWALEILAKRPQTDFRIIPLEWFVREKPYLIKIPPYVAEPYLEHHRGVDQYGYSPIEANSYWVPGEGRGEVMVLQYSDRIRIYREREMLVEYRLPPFGTRFKKFKPEGTIETKRPALKATAVDVEEAKLKEIAPQVAAFLDFVLKLKGVQRSKIIHELYRLQARMAPSLFIQTIERALAYGVSDTAAIERIAVYLLRDALFDTTWQEAPVKFQGRDIYREGRLSADPDLSIYQEMLRLSEYPETTPTPSSSAPESESNGSETKDETDDQS